MRHPTAMFGRQSLSDSIFLFVPEHQGQPIKLKNEIRQFIESFPRSNINCESAHYPINVTLGNKVITCTPLMGTLDKGIYLTSKAIKELGLKQLPGLANTRHGPVKQYAANDVNVSLDACPNSSYKFPVIYEAPQNSQHPFSEANIFHGGIIGLSSLINHDVVFCFEKVYVLSKEQSAAITQGMVCDKILEMPQNVIVGEDSDFDKILQDVNLSQAYQNANQAVQKADKCRNCGTQSNELKSCGTCNREKSEHPVHYCSVKCQKEDWNLRHKEEHSKKPNVVKVEKDDLAAKVSAMKIDDESKPSKQSQDLSITY